MYNEGTNRQLWMFLPVLWRQAHILLYNSRLDIYFLSILEIHWRKLEGVQWVFDEDITDSISFLFQLVVKNQWRMARIIISKLRQLCLIPVPNYSFFRSLKCSQQKYWTRNINGKVTDCVNISSRPSACLAIISLVA